MKRYVLATPDRPNWAAAVQRAADLLRINSCETLVNTCQNVPLKYLPQLKAEAEKMLQM